MSFENKGSVPVTIYVTCEPDRSGNFVCDGTADDVQIQAAINYVGSQGGGVVHLGQGDYELTAQITDGGFNNIVLEGEGWDTRLTVAVAGIANHIIDIIGQTGWIIRNLYLDCTNQTGASNNGIQIGDGCTDCKVEGCYVTGAVHGGINIERRAQGTQRIEIINNWCIDNGDDGIIIFAANCLIEGNIISGVTNNNGISTWDAQWVTIKGNIVLSSITGGGIALETGSQNIIIDSNIVYQSTGSCIRGYNNGGSHILIVNNHFYPSGYGVDTNINNQNWNIEGNFIFGGSHGIQIRSPNCHATSNYCYNQTTHGITILSGGTEASVRGNFIDGNSETDRGINIEEDSFACTGNTVIGVTSRGIQAYSLTDGIIATNRVLGAGWGIVLFDATYIFVNTNIVSDFGVGIYETGTSDYNKIGRNELRGCTDPANIIGTHTSLLIKPFQFTDVSGGSATVQLTSPVGCYVFDAGATAIAWGQLPADVQQVVRLKVWAIAKDGPAAAGGNMHCEFTFNAGASNAAYNTAGKSWNVVNKDSVEVDYIADDVIHWVLTDADTGDSEISALVAGDSFEILTIYESVASPDGDTDAKFRVVEVEYV